jgi:hypothetical protein
VPGGFDSEFFLTLKMVKKCAFGDAGRFADVVHRGGGVAFGANGH